MSARQIANTNLSRGTRTRGAIKPLAWLAPTAGTTASSNVRLEDAAEVAGWHVFGRDMLLRLGNTAYHPDVQLVCDPDDRHEQYTQRPCLIVEVSSDRTVRFDHTEKLAAYRTILTLRAYVIVSQRE